MTAIYFSMFILISASASQHCPDKKSVDITDGEIVGSAIVKDGVSYTPEYVFAKNTSEGVRTFGCLCEIKKCLRKCCPIGSVLKRRQCVLSTEEDKLLSEGVKLHFFNAYKGNADLKSMDLVVVDGRPCKGMYRETAKWYVQADGQLFIELPNAIPPWTLRGPDKYCIDTILIEDPVTGAKSSKLDALICFADEEDSPHYVIKSTCMVISCVFILATVAVYGWLPELRNLHGRVLMVYLLCLFFGFAALSAMQIMLHINYIFPMTCITLTIIIYFSLLSAFFWLNVMCFDIWWTFSGKRGMSNRLSSTKARFLAYCVYAFGIPSLLTIILISLEFSGLPAHPFMPMLRHQGCFIHGLSKLIYLYSPMLLVCLSNMVFFVLTALKINEIKKQTSVLKSQDNGKHDEHRKDKQRLTLYFKLYMVMGINWILEVISALYPDIEGLWNFTDAYNVLIGFTIFIIFVCKRKIFRLIKKRIKNTFQGSNSEDVNADVVDNELKDFSNAHIRRRQMKDQRASQETIRTSIGSANSNKVVTNIV